MLKNISRLMVAFVSSLLFMTGIYMAGAASSSPDQASGIIIDSPFEEISPALLDAITRVIELSSADLFPGNHYGITSVRIEVNWGLLYIASLDGPYSTEEYPGAGESGKMIIAHQVDETNWVVALEGTTLFVELLEKCPSELMESEAKNLLLQLAAPTGIDDAGQVTSIVEYKFPWAIDAAWRWWTRNGNPIWHGGSNCENNVNDPPRCAIDLGTSDANKAILAAAGGVVEVTCNLPQSNTINMRIVDDNGVAIDYFHINKSSVDFEVIYTGADIGRAQVLGNAWSGNLNDGCGVAYQLSQSGHVHLVIPTTPIVIDGWIFDYPSTCATKGSETKCAGGYFTSTNVPYVGGWPSNPTVNIPIVQALHDQGGLTIVSDGNGGGIIMWYTTTNGAISVQRVDSAGMIQWPQNGIFIKGYSAAFYGPDIIADGFGGAIIAWEHNPTGSGGDVRVQRIDGNGNLLWRSEGVIIASGEDPQIISDENGGAIVTWTGWGGGLATTRVQRISSGGQKLWDPNGIAVSSTGTQRRYPVIARDESGGAIVAWKQFTGSEYDLYAQRIDANGSILWTGGGVPVSTAPGNDDSYQIISDGFGGVIVAWKNTAIYAQRMGADGSALWTTNGELLASGGTSPAIVPDSAGGAIVAWRNANIYAQRLNSSGGQLWSAGGLVINTSADFGPYITSDGSGGLIATWVDNRGGAQDIYAQLVDSGGNPVWTSNGIAICTATNSQQGVSILNNSTNGAIATWMDLRNTSVTGADIYAQNVNMDGTLPTDPVPPPMVINLFGIEVTQGIQDLTNSTILVADKPTFARVHVRSISGETIQGVHGQLIGRRNGEILPGSPLSPANAQGRLDVDGWNPAPDRGDLNDSFYFQIPSTWITGTIELEFRMTDQTYSCSEPDGESNCVVSVTFAAPPHLDISISSVYWEDSSGGVHLPEIEDIWAIVDDIEAEYPIAELNWNIAKSLIASFDGPPDLADILEGLSNQRSLDGSDRIYYGLLVDWDGSTSLGLGYLPGNVSAGYYRTTDPTTAAHEIGHNLGRYHTDCTHEEDQIDPEYPYDGGFISQFESGPNAFYGFHITSMTVFTPTVGDLEGYCRPRWVSDWTYEHIKDALDTQALNTATAIIGDIGDPVTLISGRIDPVTVTGSINTVLQTTAQGTVTLPDPGSYSIRFEDALGQELASYSFEPSLLTEGTERIYSFLLPTNPNTTRVVLLHNSTPLDDQLSSSNPPTITLEYPNGGEMLSGYSVTLSWIAGDADDDALEYTVQYSNDGGAFWQTLATDWATTTYDLHLDTLPGTDRGLIRILASDGFLTAADQSDSVFTVVSHPPVASIQLPDDSSSFLGNQVITILGQAYDTEDGILDDTELTWVSDRDGILGYGSLSLMASDLSEGIHIITLIATDGDQQSAMDTVSIQITHVPDPMLAVAPGTLSFTAPGDGTVPTQTFTITNPISGFLSFDVTPSRPWILLGADYGLAPMEINVSIDLDLLAVGQYTGTITITSTDAINSPQFINVSVIVSEVACSAVAEIPESECETLKSLYLNNGGASWYTNTGWLASNTPCNWFGIECNEGHVTSIDLSNNRLEGEIPSAIGNLTNIQFLDLSGNQLRGGIPSTIGGVFSLTTLDLSDNLLSSIIVPSIGNLTNLTSLNLSINELEGTIPPEFGSLSGLVTLDLSNNQLGGLIPEEICSLANLETIELGYNMLSAEPDVTTCISLINPTWDQTQTIPPINILAASIDYTSITLDWDPILYQSDRGCYLASYSTIQGGPYEAGCATADKTVSTCPIEGLQPGTTYYFVIQTYTPAHGVQRNDLLSDESSELDAATLEQIPVSSVAISGPITGTAGADYSFTALVQPADATEPITYTWSTENLISPQGYLTATYHWDQPGVYTISVTAENCCGSANSTSQIEIVQEHIPVSGVLISGPITGTAGADYSFTALVQPADATEPITYTWSTENLVSSQGYLTATYHWDQPGVYTISVTAENCCGSVEETYRIEILSVEPNVYHVYLPIVARVCRKD